jgi:hypothetical protein
MTPESGRLEGAERRGWANWGGEKRGKKCGGDEQCCVVMGLCDRRRRTYHSRIWWKISMSAVERERGLRARLYEGCGQLRDPNKASGARDLTKSRRRSQLVLPALAPGSREAPPFSHHGLAVAASPPLIPQRRSRRRVQSRRRAIPLGDCMLQP